MPVWAGPSSGTEARMEVAVLEHRTRPSLAEDG
jgi:hypothetical protein